MFCDSVLDALRRKYGASFRKKLGVYHYKIGHQEYHKKPGVVPLYLKEKLKKQNNKKSALQLKKLERDSDFPFGRWDGRRFIFDEKKVPFYNVPDLTGFTLKPYVSVHTPKIEPKLIEEVRKLNDYTDEKNFGRFTSEKSDTLKLTQTRLIPEKKEKKGKTEEHQKENKEKEATPNQ